MTSIVKLTPLLGGGTKELPHDAPHAYLLQVDQYHFLLDCGWTPSLDVNEHLSLLKKHLPKVDAVLLSYPDELHLGLLPHCVGRLGLGHVPIYATGPVYKMGQMFLYDLFLSRKEIDSDGEQLFTLDEVDRTFEMVTQLKYNQTVHLKGKGEGLSITPVPAGHMIGGSIWKISKDGEDENLVYAVDFNHKKERHLNSCDMERISRPSLLITDGYNARVKPIRRRDQDELLMTTILQTLRGNGNVLLSVDTAGRVLELAHMMDSLWQMQDSGLLAYSLALLNNVSYNVIEFAKSQIEWMSEKLMRSGFEGQRTNPFQFRHLKLCHSMAEVSKVPSPKVVLASMPDLECGFARELFMQWCSDARNTVILTSRAAEGTLGHDLIANGSGRVIDLDVSRRVKLTGYELEEYRRRQKEEKGDGKDANADEAMLMDDESSDEEMEDVEAGKKHDIIVKNDPAPPPGKAHSSFKSIKARHAMYPFHEEKIKYDDYGEILKPEEMTDSTLDAIRNINGGAEANTSGSMDASSLPVDVEAPSKCVVTRKSFDVRAQVKFIDFEGRTDGEALKKVIQHMRPRRVILVRGQEDHLKSLAASCNQILGGGDEVTADGEAPKELVLVPKQGETVDATTESFIYQVRLPESLVSLLNFRQGKGALLSWVDGRITLKHDELADVTGQDKATDDDKAVIPTLMPVDEESRVGHAPVFVNELKLHDFKMVLMRSGISAEFDGGVLFCGKGTVALRRHDSGRVTIEGTVCDLYYKVRELLYEQYAIV